MLNIAYKTTRQWNPGDEFILLGVRNIFNKAFGTHNAVIYNCNPDVRPMEQVRGARTWQLPLDYTQHHELAVADGYFRIGFMDNSIKFDSDLSYVDYAVFAGTPEILSHRVLNFYEHIINHQLPCFVLGAGYWETPGRNQSNVLKQAKLLTFRSVSLAQKSQYDGYNAQYSPCPALCSATFEKTIQTPQEVGLVFSIGANNSVPFAAVNEDCASYIQKLYPYLIQQLSRTVKFRVICHYIDELATAHQIFRPFNIPVYYSYEAKDYFDIYAACDFVLSSRVHGCGIAASLGIPSIHIAHDDRADTCKGFLTKEIDYKTPVKDVLDSICAGLKTAHDQNLKLKQHKKAVFEKYVTEVKSANTDCPNYSPFLDEYYCNKKIERIITSYFKKTK